MRFAIVGLGLLAACGDEPAEETCVPDLPDDCAPLYGPDFETAYTQTFAGSCALGGCHDATAAGGLDLSTPDLAYAGLVDDGRVIPGDAACSTLVLRLEGHLVDVMPPGAPLPEAERCAIRQWIDAGAARE